MVFANVRKVVRIVLPFDHFHRLQLMRSVCMFCFNRGIQSVSVCGDTRSSDRISRRKTPMLVTRGRTEPGAESGHWAIWPIPGRLYSRSNSLSWGDNCPNGFLLRSEMSHKLKDFAGLSSKLRLSNVFALNTICPFSERRLGPQ